MNSHFLEYTADDAPDASRAPLRAAREQFGFIPSALARMAASPSAVAGFNRLLAIFEKTSLTKLEREVVAMTMGLEVGCEVCIALHSAMLARAGAASLAEGLRRRATLESPRDEALRAFVRSALAHRGEVPDAEIAAFLEAGFTEEQALDVVLGMATYVLSTFANRLTRARVDEAFLPFAQGAEAGR